MNKKEKLTKKEIIKKFIAVYLAAFSALLFIFYLGYYCGSVYAASEDDYSYFQYDGFQNSIISQDFNKDNHFVYFYSKREIQQASGTLTQYGIFYFDLQDVPFEKNGDEYLFGTTGSDIKLYFYQLSSSNGSALTDSIQVTTFSKYHKVKINFATNECNIYKLVNGKAEPWVFGNITDENGAPCGMYNFYTNIEELENHDKLQIVFTPKFEGEVNRALEGDSNYTAKSFSFQVINNTAHPYQYALGIFPEYISVSPSTFTGAAASANWLYMTQQYVISQDLTQKDYWSYNNNYTTLSKSTIWHPINSGNSDYGYINYSQVAIEANVKYRVVCVAFPCSEGQSSTYLKSSELFYDPAYLEGLEDYFDYTNQININSGHVVCDQIFYISDLSDVPYNPNDTWGSWQTPYDSYEDYKEALYSYNDVVDADGKVISKGQNLWSDKNSYIHNISGGSSGSNRVPVEVSSDTSAFIQSSNGIVAFFGNVLTIFPPEITTILLFGVTAIVFVIVLKFIRG